MRFVKALVRTIINQTKNALKIISGSPLNEPSLGSMTLDLDDVKIAKSWLTNKQVWGNNGLVKQFESEFNVWNGSKYTFAFMGGRVALSACIYALGLNPGDEAIIPGYTCIVVTNAFLFSGIKVVYTDIELETFGLDVFQVEKNITSKTKAILLHHLYGLVCRDYEAILKLAKKHNIKVIEDCAQSTGAEFRGKKIGNYGDVGFYSSEQSKIMNTIQGGLVVTNDDEVAKKIEEYYEKSQYPDTTWIERQLYNVILNYYRFKNPHRWWKGDLANILYGGKRLIPMTIEEEHGIQPIEYQRKMPSPIAAIGLNQLKKIDKYNELRRKNSKKWDKWCELNGYKKPSIINESVPVFLRYPVLVEPEKKENLNWLKDELGLEIGVWFVSNTHPMKQIIEGCPNADTAVRRCVNFPTILD